MKKLDLGAAVQLMRNMGPVYLLFRLCYELLKRIKLLRLWFPVFTPDYNQFFWQSWLNQSVNFFPRHKLRREDGEIFSLLREKVNLIQSKRYCYFYGEWLKSADWHTHPITGYRYDATRHWTLIPDFPAEAGDIKYIWEKSRFTFLYDFIRYDNSSGENCAELVFSEIEDWINTNPVNCGPNWMCSQEIALRTFSWTFALFYYRNNPALHKQRFEKICESLYRHFQHIASNNRFARFAVRNNHCITEALALYTAGLLFPFFSESEDWKREGKRRFELEITFQIQESGTYLQHSMNYHRMIVQLLTFALQLAHLNGDRWCNAVYERAVKSLIFLRSCQDDVTGWLPNYGNNDGTLVFPLSSCHYRDFRPQLYALASVLEIDLGYGPGTWEEEARWIGNSGFSNLTKLKNEAKFFNDGYFIYKDTDALTFIRNASYKDRPHQADNLHLDIWVDGENLLQDAGTYLYNTDSYWVNYFSGTQSHNTIQLGNYDQMKRGPRFVWFNWITKSDSQFTFGDDESELDFIFEGYFEGFKELGKGILHRRKVTKKSGILHWSVEDWIENLNHELPMHQSWNLSEDFSTKYQISAFLSSGTELLPERKLAWKSETYGHKKEITKLVFTTKERYIRTEIFRRELAN